MTEDEGGRVVAGGFGGRTFRANGAEIIVEPLRRVHADGSSGIMLGFPFATLSGLVSDDQAAELAEYLSSPVRAVAPELFRALELAIEYWAHRQQRYKNRHPVWVQTARAAMSKATLTGAGNG